MGASVVYLVHFSRLGTFLISCLGGLRLLGAKKSEREHIRLRLEGHVLHVCSWGCCCLRAEDQIA